MVTARTKEFKKRSAAHLLHASPEGLAEPELIFEKGKGIILIDTDGKEYIDLVSFYNCVSLGYGRKELIDAAYEEMNKLSFGVAGGHYSNVPAIEYAETLAEFTPKNINHFHFFNGGSEANESAVKYARAYWDLQGKAGKTKIICLMGAYHGATYFVGGLLADYDMRAHTGPEASGIVRIPNYNCYRCPLDLKYPDCGIACAKYLERVIEEEGEDSVAAFIAEPVQATFGAITPPPEYFPIVREICTRHHVLWIDDEVITGFCRTGKMFAVEHWNLEPDMLIMAKGIAGVYWPLAGVGMSDEVYALLSSHPLMVMVTTGGHPVGMAVAKAALDLYIKERIAEHVTKVGNHVRERLENEFLPLPNVGHVGGLGLLQAIEIVLDKQTKRRFPAEMNVRSVVLGQALEKGLLSHIYSVRKDDRLLIYPPLIITEGEVDKALDILYLIIAGLKDLKVK